MVEGPCYKDFTFVNREPLLKGRLSTFGVLIKIAGFVKKKKYISCIKSI